MRVLWDHAEINSHILSPGSTNQLDYVNFYLMAKILKDHLCMFIRLPFLEEAKNRIDTL